MDFSLTEGKNDVGSRDTEGLIVHENSKSIFDCPIQGIELRPS